MFRSPRQNSVQDLRDKLLPSTGRAPTPPNESARTPAHTASTYFGPPNPAPSTNASPAVRRTSSTKNMPLKNGYGKMNGKRQNQSILNFFGKQAGKGSTSESNIGSNDSLFFEERGYTLASPVLNGQNGEDTLPERARYHELEMAVKRRRVKVDDEDIWVRTPSPEIRPGSSGADSGMQEPKEVQQATSRKDIRHWGGFVDDSSSGDEDVVSIPHTALSTRSNSINGTNGQIKYLAPQQPAAPDRSGDRKLDFDVETGARLPDESDGDVAVIENSLHETEAQAMSDDVNPSLHRETTSMLTVDDFEQMGDFEDDELFGGGEEMMERRWMEEQRMLGIRLDEDSKSESNDEDVMTPEADAGMAADRDQTAEAACPVCSASLMGTTEQQASAHVNACLDGNPMPLSDGQEQSPKVVAQGATGGGPPMKRFQRAAIARPGQRNPYSLSDTRNSNGSAFSRLMSGHAEDTAWAEAALNEAQSRGKPAYQRTCPFYKIMPGLSICVDAFRYGKVEGQNAYFLSHFHSDHYIGLTSSWSHGPVYCSRVTANLVREQLRVDPKWVVPLEFEKKVEIPNTQGVSVTMLPANHCPGSSIFLFEKAVGKTSKGAPKLNRILHCGDFRACPAHVNHPLLKPDVVDAITGQTAKQVIDTCYLDTTYLTPKYAFPPQSDVIDACAQMCVSLSKETVDYNDSWERAKLERAGSAMTKFLEKPSPGEVMIRPDDEEEKPAGRGRLLVVIGTYSIGKERMCLGIAQALKSKIYASPAKMRVCKCLEDGELDVLLTSNPLEAQVHMQTLMEIRAETLHDYLVMYKGHFSRAVGFRPTGWN